MLEILPIPVERFDFLRLVDFRVTELIGFVVLRFRQHDQFLRFAQRFVADQLFFNGHEQVMFSINHENRTGCNLWGHPFRFEPPNALEFIRAEVKV